MSELAKKTSFESAEELAVAAARDWMIELARRDRSRTYGAALSGGRVAQPFFSELVAESRRLSEDWENLHFFWADERCVPPDDPESNFLTARERLFEPLRIPDGQIHRLRGEIDCEMAATQAEEEIRGILPLDRAGLPVLDLVFLGIGEDGHVASLFPGEPAEAVDSRAVYRCVIGPKPPPRRITIGYSTLAAARQVWILASGQGKVEAYKRLMEKDPEVPAVRVVMARQQTRLYEDISKKKV